MGYIPKISVIVPVHNVADYVENTVYSILASDMKDIEVILVENASQDDSYQKCLALAEHDSRIRVLRIDRSGLSLARNTGIDVSSSEYVCFIDSDDVVEKDMFSSLYENLVNSGADIAMCNYVKDYPNGHSEYPYEETGLVRLLTPAQTLSELLQEKISSSACIMLCRKSLFDKVRFPEDRYYEDHAVTYQLVASATNGCVHTGKSLYHYFQREGSIVHSNDFKKTFDYLTASKGRIEFIISYPEFDTVTRNELLEFNADIYIRNIIIAIRQARTKQELSMLKTFKSIVPSILAYGAVSGKGKSRLLRIRYMWPIFCKMHRRKKKISE